MTKMDKEKFFLSFVTLGFLILTVRNFFFFGYPHEKKNPGDPCTVGEVENQ